MSKDKPHTLVSWIGGNDLKATGSSEAYDQALGPIAATLIAQPFDTVELLYNYPEHQVKPYLAWLQGLISTPIRAHSISLSSPVNFGEIYLQVDLQLSRLTAEGSELFLLLSPGTPAMQAVWILLGKTRYPCQFYQSSIEQGVQQVDIPFELSAEYLPAAKNIGSEKISQLAKTSPPINAAFDNIVTRNPHMQYLKMQAQILAEREVPVLIYGETGTGKELFARAIHNASHRASKPFVPVNCGAIPTELVDSILFGHKKGAFTGALADKVGLFEQANGGTLFLDEFGELEPSIQVRLLRVLQEGTFIPVGGIKEQKVDVRLITATHRNLMSEVVNGNFREDLFYRVAVGVLHLPPLRERAGDVSLLADSLVNAMSIHDPMLRHKKISPDAKNLILQYAWRGNVRELQSTLLRAALWCQGDNITATDIRQALFHMPERETRLMEKDVSQGVDIQEIIGNIAANYIRKALEHSGQNKTRAAKLLGLKNYQTLNNWMEKYGIS
ncbi:sigma 54-interacting transcriptional regulator [Pectobacterium brasiliense]|uniref:sigma-54 interaction domain-containing protein n=2 Tax=Pectobacteriaceae TaxID=1903410 RepID=UPI0019690D52|nr:sigma 54-interacting transcriptional regulator [Pectobacterium brasiliense]MBN3172994.1 sigma 54-interacting transcriptional regulator [Pectobacterium brasiliense]UKE84371.1 sigma 54-interacting transcriptional regulator [Pectobacterium sp. PL152]